MNLTSLLVWNQGTIFRWFAPNPFRPVEARRSPCLAPIKPLTERPVLPAWMIQNQKASNAGRLSARCGEFLPEDSRTRLSALLLEPSVVLPAWDRAANEARQRRPLGRAERIEAVLLKLMLGLFLLASVGCGFGVQHIAYVRQKNALCGQLRQREFELHKVNQAYRSLESCVARQAAQEFQPPAAIPVVVKRPAQRTSARS